MESTEYKMLCQQPNIFGRFAIEETARLLPPDSELTAKLQATLKQEPIEKPFLHNGEKQTERFRVGLSTEQAAHIADILLSAEAGAVMPNGDTTSHASFIASLVDAWNAYAEFKQSE